jgi:hypothetical protein
MLNEEHHRLRATRCTKSKMPLKRFLVAGFERVVRRFMMPVIKLVDESRKRCGSLGPQPE